MRYVHAHEFRCPCCAENFIDLGFVDRLNVAREKAKKPFIISSGFRCDRHNSNVNGSTNSAHMDGLAADIRAETSHDRHEILKSLMGVGFNRIGIYAKHIHVDQSVTLPQCVMWYGKYR